MKKPNDKQRPNTKGSIEDRERTRNFRYLHVSKRILEIPVLNPDGSLTNIKQMVAEKHGRTYINTNNLPSKRDVHREEVRLAKAGVYPAGFHV